MCHERLCHERVCHERAYRGTHLVSLDHRVTRCDCGIDARPSVFACLVGTGWLVRGLLIGFVGRVFGRMCKRV